MRIDTCTFETMLSKSSKILRNRYVLVLLGLFVYISFFDAQDLISQIKLRWNLHQLHNQIEYYQTHSEEVRLQIDELSSNKESMEKFAREQYRMKRENEDIFVIIEQEP